MVVLSVSLDAVAADPGVVVHLSAAVRQTLVLRAAAALAALAAWSANAEQPPSASASSMSSSEPEWLDSDGVTQRFGLDKRWLADHARELRRLRITTRPSRKVVLYHVARLRRYLESRCG
ncbi:MAG: hypothetical protein ACRD4T_09240 [Candidatus Acidiferrales bacterium]